MGALRRYWLRILIGLALASPFIMDAAGMIDLGVLRTLEYFGYDARLNLTLPGTVDPRIVIVDIDEKSLAVEGRWPWSRYQMAKLVDVLFDKYHVSVLGFDVVFAEHERNAAALDELEQKLKKQGQTDLVDRLKALAPRADQQFAASLLHRPVVLGYYFSRDNRTTGELPEPYLPAVIADTMNVPAPQALGYGANLPVLQNAAKTGGFFDNPLSDADGVFRRAPMLQSYKGALYESLSLAVAQLYLGKPMSIGEHNEKLTIGSHVIPVDQDMAALVPYRGRQGSFPYVSASDVLNQTVPDPSVLKGKIVLVGTTAPGLYDLRSTPVQKVYAGVEIHANLISGILDSRFRSHPAYAAGAELLGSSLLGIALAVAFPMLGAIGGAVLGAVALAGAVGVNLYLWVADSLDTTIAPVLAMILVLFLFNVAYGFIVESRSRRALAYRFGQYVPPELVKRMSDNPEQYSMRGERRDMSVMFSDVRGFSNLSENMDPKELSELMNELLTALTRVIHEHRGTIDKYMGDAVMAFWGAPLHDPHHASGAVTAALEMVKAVEGVKEDFRRRGWPEIRMGIGINSGSMNVGDMGSEFRMAYTVMGDAVNLGSRLEGLTRTYGVDIVVSEYTARAAPEFAYRELDRVRVKGRDTPVDIFEPLGIKTEISEQMRNELAEYSRGLRLYRERQWREAEKEFQALVESAGDNALYQMYLERSHLFSAEPPPPTWDGVFKFVTK